MYAFAILLTNKEIIADTLHTSIFSHAVLAVRIDIFATEALSLVRVGGVIKAGGALVWSCAGLALLVKSSAFEASLSLEIILITNTLGASVHSNT